MKTMVHNDLTLSAKDVFQRARDKPMVATQIRQWSIWQRMSESNPIADVEWVCRIEAAVRALSRM